MIQSQHAACAIRCVNADHQIHCFFHKATVYVITCSLHILAVTLIQSFAVIIVIRWSCKRRQVGFRLKDSDKVWKTSAWVWTDFQEEPKAEATFLNPESKLGVRKLMLQFYVWFIFPGEIFPGKYSCINIYSKLPFLRLKLTNQIKSFEPNCYKLWSVPL